MKKIGLLITAVLFSVVVFSQKYPYDGLDSNLGNLYRMSNAKTRSISPENFTGEKVKGGMADLKDKDATDPIRFDSDLKVIIQDLGWRQGGRYLPQKSDIVSVVYWYQAEPHTSFPKFPKWEMLEVN